jgi:hypothetical protein
VTGPVTEQLEVAFETWTMRFGRWWPRSHTVRGRDEAVVELQPYVGGAIGERLPDGTHHAWGRVTTWDPPEELGYEWHFGRERNVAGWLGLLPHYRDHLEKETR